MALGKGPMEGVAVNPAFWKNKRVLLTGHTGFKGSWLSLWLQSLDAHVVGYALTPPTEPNLFDIAKVSGGMESITGDVRDLVKLQAVFSEHKPEIVIHMAAQPLVRYSYIEPVETYSTNVMGTVNLLEAVRATDSVKAVINVTSDKCYENREWTWGYRENEAMGGYDPYSSSKGCAELVTAAYRNSYFSPESHPKHGVALASARAGNVIGGGDWAEDRLIPDIIRSIIQGQPVKIRNPRSIRPWQHVLEPLSGYLILAEKLYEVGSSFAQAWNFGPGDGGVKPVQWIVERMVHAWGEEADWVLDSSAHAHEAYSLKLDCSKANALLGWSPAWSLEEALKNVLVWYRGFRDGDDMRSMTFQQISQYTKGLKKR